MAAVLVDTLKQLFAALVVSRTGKPESRAFRERLSEHSAAGHDEEVKLRFDLERWPTSAEAHIRLGALLETTGRVAEAEAMFRRAIHLHGDNVLAHYNLAIVL
ncbi:MAG TPA: tetratricopeptide repeat protein, partial [Casimicrobiaceae bacterium]|nr:tetratricopeptide repeat protein [Casimicrobiaceae bacterium]